MSHMSPLGFTPTPNAGRIPAAKSTQTSADTNGAVQNDSQTVVLQAALPGINQSFTNQQFRMPTGGGVTIPLRPTTLYSPPQPQLQQLPVNLAALRLGLGSPSPVNVGLGMPLNSNPLASGGMNTRPPFINGMPALNPNLMSFLMRYQQSPIQLKPVQSPVVNLTNTNIVQSFYPRALPQVINRYIPQPIPLVIQPKAEKRVIDLSTHFQGEYALKHMNTTSGPQYEQALRKQYQVQQESLGSIRVLSEFAKNQNLDFQTRMALDAADQFFTRTVMPAQDSFQVNTANVPALQQNYSIQQQSLQQYINLLNGPGGNGLKDANGNTITDVIYTYPEGSDQSSQVNR